MAAMVTIVSPLQVGDVLDHYRIGELAARGGMASVYHATDLETGAPVAIKVPHPEAEMDVVFFDRFQREAEIGRELDHPGVVKVLPKGRQTRLYIAMEWAKGRLLRRWDSSSKCSTYMPVNDGNMRTVKRLRSSSN